VNPPDWYRDARQHVAEVFSRSTAAGPASVSLSPSGRYRLEVTTHLTGPQTWAYSRGRVSRVSDGHLVAQVDRNFSAFPASWSEGHPTGHDYLVCGEDYQCQTIIELDTAVRVDHVPAAARTGGGFCWAAHYPSPDGKLIFVDGCVWAGPYELVLYDFSQPLRLPYRELRRWPVWKVEGFQTDGSFVFEYELEVRTSDNRPVRDLTEEEQEQLDSAPDYKAVARERTFRVRWFPTGDEECTPLD
jgi:hypothetical protein